MQVNGVDWVPDLSIQSNLSKIQNNSSTVPFQSVLSQETATLEAAKPKTLNDFFVQASNTYGVDIDLLKAVAYTESNYKTDVISSSGAQGVMQLMPSTAKALGVNNAMDPEENIMGGAKLLSQLLSKYKDNIKLALAAYNAGGGAVDKYGGIPPYSETQNYVKKVLERLNDSSIQNNASLSTAFNAPSLSSTAASSQPITTTTDLVQAKNSLPYPTGDLSVTSTAGTIDPVVASATSTSKTSNSSILKSVLNALEEADDSSSKSTYNYDDYVDFLNEYSNIVSQFDDTANYGSLNSSSNSNIAILGIIQALAKKKS